MFKEKALINGLDCFGGKFEVEITWMMLCVQPSAFS